MTIWIQPAAFIQQVQHMHANVKFVSLLGFPSAGLCYHLVLPWFPVVVFGFALHSFGFALFSFICVMVLFSFRFALHWYYVVFLWQCFCCALLSLGVASYLRCFLSVLLRMGFLWLRCGFALFSFGSSLCSMVLFVVLFCCFLVFWFHGVCSLQDLSRGGGHVRNTSISSERAKT